MGKESACSAGDAGSIPRLVRSPGGGMATHSSILPAESHGQGSLEACGPQVTKSWETVSTEHTCTHL